MILSGVLWGSEPEPANKEGVGLTGYVLYIHRLSEREKEMLISRSYMIHTNSRRRH